jgi:ATP synthase protein I
MLRHLRRPVATVLRWQLGVTVAAALIAGWLAGLHGAISAVAGGLVSVVAGLAAAFVAARGNAKSAGEVLLGALKAEGVKVALIVILLWLVLATYQDIVALAFIASFLVTVLIFAMAFFVHET